MEEGIGRSKEGDNTFNEADDRQIFFDDFVQTPSQFFTHPPTHTTPMKRRSVPELAVCMQSKLEHRVVRVVLGGSHSSNNPLRVVIL